MLPTNRTLAALFLFVVPWARPIEGRRQQDRSSPNPPPERHASETCSHPEEQQLEEHSGAKQLRRHTSTSERLPILHGRTSPTLETLNADVFRLIALELVLYPRNLQALACCSRTLRDLTSPILFLRCRLGPGAIPPPAIRPFVRYFRVPGHLIHEDYSRNLPNMIDSLPSLTAIVFENGGCVPWELLKPCLTRPRLTSLTFNGMAQDPKRDRLYPDEELLSMPKHLTSFHYATPVFRDVEASMANYRGQYDYRKVISREALALSALVKGMNGSVERLTLPVETAPLQSMAKVAWPHLRELAFGGSYGTTTDVAQLSVFLSTLPNMRKLSIQVRPVPRTELRAPILGNHPSPSEVLRGLRSLTLTYPDPNDAIFSIDTTYLSHLSLRDCPRYYHKLFGRNYGEHWGTPLLSPDDCLVILQRMDLPELTSLEIVYRAEKAGSDDALLTHVASKYPKLTQLEIHRYRRDRKEVVAHMQIAKILAEAKSLRRLYLYLDMHDDPGLYCSRHDALYKAWFPTFKRRGAQILQIMQVCPQLDFIALLYFGQRLPFWAEFHPKRCARPRFFIDLYQTPESKLLPLRW